MRLLLQLFFIAALLPLVAAPSLSEGLVREFNGKKWKEIDHHEDANGLVYEYTPVDQNQTNWTDKVTIQVFPGKSLSLKDYVTQFNSVMVKRKDVTFESRAIEDKPEEKIFEWSLINQGGQPEMIGWMRVLVDDKALKAIHVQQKRPNDVDALRNTWLPIIKEYDFTPRS